MIDKVTYTGEGNQAIGSKVLQLTLASCDEGPQAGFIALALMLLLQSW